MNTAKPRLLILSDLWGNEKSDWIIYYTSILENYFELKYYDCCDLGTIDKSSYSEESLHHQFLNGGIEKAVANLLQEEKEFISVLAFSIGGLIAWKAGLSDLKIQNLYAISSTRLRYEIEKPAGTIELFFGENDIYKPNRAWFKKLALQENFFSNQGHELYKQKDFADRICKIIVEQIKKE